MEESRSSDRSPTINTALAEEEGMPVAIHMGTGGSGRANSNTLTSVQWATLELEDPWYAIRLQVGD